MKLLYILNQRFPTEKAYGTQVAKMCAAFAGAGVEVELLVPSRKNGITDDAFNYYAVPHAFRVSTISSPDFYLPGKLDVLAFAVKNIISAIRIAYCSLSRHADVVYSRDEIALYVLSFIHSRLVFEAHNLPRRRTLLFARLMKKNVTVVALTNAMKNDLVAFGFSPSSIFVAPDGVDSSIIRDEHLRPSDRSSARKQLDIPSGMQLVVYTGSLYTWKGVYCLADAAALMRDANFLVIGGDTRGEEEAFKKYVTSHGIRNVISVGYIRSEERVRTYLAAADVLVLPNTGTLGISSRYTSPLKLFQYLAARRPIVASDLPSLRDVLSDENAVLVKPDDPAALAQGIRKVLNDPSFARKICEVGFAQVTRYTWERRASSIIGHLEASKRP